jgi:hypothetical protein
MDLFNNLEIRRLETAYFVLVMLIIPITVVSFLEKEHKMYICEFFGM